MMIEKKIKTVRSAAFVAIDRWPLVSHLSPREIARVEIETAFTICIGAMLTLEEQAVSMGVDIHSPACGPDPLERK